MDYKKTEKEDTYMASFSSEKALKEADAKDMVVVLPDDFTLQIDIDTAESYRLFLFRIKYLGKWFNLTHKQNPSKKGEEHRHIYVRLSEAISSMERIFLQLYLGSDSKREFLSLMRIKNDDPHPTLFFENKG